MRTWTAVSLALASAFLAGVLGAALHTGYPVRRMPDGGNVGLVGITSKNPQVVSVGSAWDRLLAAGRADRTDGDWKITLPAGPAPTAWLHYSRHYFWRSRQAPVAVLRSASGDEWLAEHDPVTGRLESPVGAVEGQSFPIFPRRQKLLKLRVYQTPGGWGPSPEQWVDFTFPNPAYRTYPSWTPEPFPVVRRSGDLKLELTSLRTGVDFPAGSAPSPVAYLAATFATFRISRNGVPDPEWVPVELAYSDATGNHLGGYEDRLTRSGNEIGFPMDGQLPSDEAAWRVRAEFSRIHSPKAQPDHLWTARQVPIPPVNSPFTWQNTPLAPGVTLQTQQVDTTGGNAIVLNIQLVRHGWHNLRVALRGVSDTGSTFTDQNAEWKEIRGGEMPHWQFRLPAATRSVDLTLSAFQSRTAEFIASPARVR